MKYSEFLSNLSYLSLIEKSPLPTLWVDISGAIIHANEAAAAHLGYSLEELIEMDLGGIDVNFSPENFARQTASMEVNPILRFESVHRKKDGSLADVEIIRNFVAENDRHLIISYVFDISERKAGERRLREIKKLLDLSRDMILIAEYNTYEIIYVNNETCRELGYTKEEMLGMNVMDIRKEEANIPLAVYQQELDKKSEMTVYDTLIRKDGTQFPVESGLSLVVLDNKMYGVAIVRDITTRLEKEHELKQKTDALEELNKNLEQKVYDRTKELENHKAHLEERVREETALRRKQESVIFAQQKFVDMGKMLNAVAHHWRQPINALGLMIQEVGELYEDDRITPEFIDYFTSTAMRVVSQMSSTIDQFKTFYTPESKKSEFEVFSTISELINLIKIQMYRNNINLEMGCSCHQSQAACDEGFILPDCGNRHTVISGYEEELKQVIMNIVDNAAESIAVRYGQDKTHPGQITIYIVTTPENITVTVEDNGRGIPEEAAEKIFEPYFTTKKDAKSTGLGLFMSKVIIEDHFRGSMKAENTGNGARIIITLPVALQKS
ncbi:MAG: PAS domain S-box protein [Deferribacterales bacterium]